MKRENRHERITRKNEPTNRWDKTNKQTNKQKQKRISRNKLFAIRYNLEHKIRSGTIGHDGIVGIVATRRFTTKHHGSGICLFASPLARFPMPVRHFRRFKILLAELARANLSAFVPRVKG